MSLLKKLFGGSLGNKSLSDEALKIAAFRHAVGGDRTGLKQLLHGQADRIEALFATWRQVPAELRDNPSDIQDYGSCLVFIAEFLKDQGRPGPWESLMGEGPNGSPIEELSGRMEHAETLRVAGLFAEQIACLKAWMRDAEGLSGPWIDDLRAKVMGALGQAELTVGNLDGARDWTVHALETCEANGDSEGVRTYSTNLAIIDAFALPPHPAKADLLLAQRLSDKGRYAQSNGVLDAILDHFDDGTADRWVHRGKLLGLQGFNLAKLREFDRAAEATQVAADHCRARGDNDGAVIYTINLAAIAELAAKDHAPHPP
ncbi:hypothetical protein [Sphingomonas sp. SAFR-052]|uniref:hypothetical protein n=1 Tax=Sphingomonas sp. SAFR-052 TaxID=3436867 RepID=UPI003F7F1F36